MGKSNIPTYIEIYSNLYRKILEGVYKEGDQIPTELELCKQNYVSRITVQKAIQKLVEQGLVNRIPGKGTFVNMGNVKTNAKPNAKIGLIMCNFSISYGMNLVKSIEKYAALNGRSVVLKNSMYDKEIESRNIIELLRLQVEGIILQPTHNEYFNSEVLKLSLNSYPMVLVDRNLAGIQLPYVGTDNRYSTEKVMNYLFSKGHRNICFMSINPKNTSTLEERLDAFQQSFIKNNYHINMNNVFTDIVSPICYANDELIRKDIENIKNHIINNPDQTCIFAAEYSVCFLVNNFFYFFG